MFVERITLSIKGMHCAARASRIERVVGKREGVGAVSVNLATEKAAVTCDPQVIRRHAIKEAIEKPVSAPSSR